MALSAVSEPPGQKCERHEGVFTMTLAHGTDRLESARLVLRRIAPEDLPFFTRIHALPEVAQYLWGQGRPRSPEETAAWLQATRATYCGCRTRSRPFFRRTPARGASPSGSACEPPVEWKQSVSRSIGTCGRSRQAALLSSSRHPLNRLRGDRPLRLTATTLAV